MLTTFYPVSLPHSCSLQQSNASSTGHQATTCISLISCIHYQLSSGCSANLCFCWCVFIKHTHAHKEGKFTLEWLININDRKCNFLICVTEKTAKYPVQHSYKQETSPSTVCPPVFGLLGDISFLVILKSNFSIYKRKGCRMEICLG